MKFIKNRIIFLNEAKIKNLILPIQAKEVAKKWGEEYLDYEEVDPTENIKQGKWKLSDEDKNLVLGTFLGSNYENINIEDIYNYYDSFPEELVKVLKESISPTDKDSKIIFENYNPKKPSLEQMYHSILDTNFKKLMVSETKKDEYIKRDELGRPLKDESNQIIKIKKKIGDPVYDEKNYVTIKSQIEAFNSAYNQDIKTSNRSIELAVNIMSDKTNPDYIIDLNIFDKDIYLSINHNPHDILNMSISRFYSSCQHLYSGSHREQLLANVFDPNSIPAFLIFESPIYKDGVKISEFLPLSRMMIRNIEIFDGDKIDYVLLFDRAYPDRMKKLFGTLIEKYSDNIETGDPDLFYTFSPDIELEKQDDISTPYMDKLGLNKVKFIGKNTKSIYLNRNYDWSNIKISPKASIENLIIDTERIPSNMSNLPLNVNRFKFKYLKLNSLDLFKQIKINKNLSFDKCYLSNNVLDDLSNFEADTMEFLSCELESNNIKDLKVLKLSLIYTLDNINRVEKILKSNNLIKELVISDDLVTSKNDKLIFNKIKTNFKDIKINVSGITVQNIK
jgi:hypothetical protein